MIVSISSVNQIPKQRGLTNSQQCQKNILASTFQITISDMSNSKCIYFIVGYKLHKSQKLKEKQYRTSDLKPPQCFLLRIFKVCPERSKCNEAFSQKKTCIKVFCTGNLLDSSQWFTCSLEIIRKPGFCSSALSHSKTLH